MKLYKDQIEFGQLCEIASPEFVEEYLWDNSIVACFSEDEETTIDYSFTVGWECAQEGVDQITVVTEQEYRLAKWIIKGSIEKLARDIKKALEEL